MIELGDPAIANDNVGAAFENRLDQIGQIACVVLVVCVGVDDNVRTRMQRCIQSRDEGTRQPRMG